MLDIVFTLDYEIHGNGDGCPMELMVEPTARLIALLERHGARLTIMADAAEILKFREHMETTGRDDCHYEAIVHQLRDAVARGHDVQLHIHSSYFNATRVGDGWQQDWSEYDFARLPYQRMDWMIRSGKAWLEDLLRPVDPDYACVAFRAANWSVSPSGNVVRALAGNGIPIDTSVFKYGRRDGLVAFDYSHAPSALVPWPVGGLDICRRDDDGAVWEVPIYSERRWLGAFLSAGRIRRAVTGRQHRIPQGPPGLRPGGERRAVRVASALGMLLRRHARKADFNQCSAGQLTGSLRRAFTRHAQDSGTPLPFVLIGHSKLFTQSNEAGLAPFLAHAAARRERFRFGTLRTVSDALPILRAA